MVTTADVELRLSLIDADIEDAKTHPIRFEEFAGVAIEKVGNKYYVVEVEDFPEG